MSAIALAAALVRGFEGCRLNAYQDDGGVWTIGYGHTGPEVHQGLTWTQADADTALARDLQVTADGMAKLISSLLTDRQKAALTSLAFNVGTGAIKGSRLIAAVNNAQWIAAAHGWVAWDHSDQTEVKGLLIRRLREAALFLEGS